MRKVLIILVALLLAVIAYLRYDKAKTEQEWFSKYVELQSELGLSIQQVDSLYSRTAELESKLSEKDAELAGLKVKLEKHERVVRVERVKLKTKPLQVESKVKRDSSKAPERVFEVGHDFGSGFLLTGSFTSLGRYSFQLNVPVLSITTAVTETPEGVKRSYLKVDPDVFEVVEWDLKVERKLPVRKPRRFSPFIALGYSKAQGPAILGGAVTFSHYMGGLILEQGSVGGFVGYMF